MELDRRRLLGAGLLGLAGLTAWPATPWAQSSPRLVTTSWQVAELLLAMGVVPVALSETATYRHRLPEPALPSGVVDLGAVWEPNLELLQSLKPDLILLPSEQAVNETVLSRIAPTRVLPEPQGSGDRIAQAEATWRTAAGWLGRTAEMDRVIAACHARIDRARERLAAAGRQRALYLVDLGAGGRQVDVFGPGCILHDTLRRLGLRNAWTDPVEDYGWVSAGLERLGDPEAQLLYFADEEERADEDSSASRSRRATERSSLWRALPLVRAGRVRSIQPAFVFGGLMTAARFAERLDLTLRNRGTGHG